MSDRKTASEKMPNRARRLSLGAVLRWFFRPLAIKLYIVFALLLAAYTVYLDAVIRSSFEGKKWQLPARVYARPLELYEGLQLTADELEQELADLGYRSGGAMRSGSYLRRGNQLTLHSRGYTFWDGREEAQQAQLSFQRGELVRLQRVDHSALPLLRLEPMEIGAIYPNHREDRILVKLESVPPLLLAALLAVEDHRFYHHYGVSPASIARAALQNIKSGAVVQGGSTLTQQLVKNYYLTRERSLSRKATEAIMSLLLELHYEKEQILQAYLNEVYLGQAGAKAVHGFGLASQHYFNRPLQELSVDRLALLVAIVRGPAYYDPWRHPQRALARRNRVLDTLVDHRLLTGEDAVWAKAQPLNLGKTSRSRYVFPAFVDLVKRQLRATYKEQDLVSNGLKIYTSFDPRVQRHAEAAVVEGLVALGDSESQAAMVVTHPATGEVLALVGGREPRYAGFNRALDARRSIGSVVKPFVYLTALSMPEKFTLATVVDDSPITLTMENGEQWSPKNYDRRDHGRVPLITALAKSYNQAAVRVGSQLGVERVAETLQRLGLQRKVNPVPSLFIGSTQLSPLEVAGLYQGLAAGGYHSPAKAIRSVLDNDNIPLRRFQYQLAPGASSDAVHLTQRALVHVGQQGSARAAARVLGPNFLFAGKTGTSNKQRDSWFAGYSGDLLAVVWLGRDDNEETRHTGSSGALPIWVKMMKSASRESLLLSPPDTMVQRWIDLDSGRPSRAGCARSVLLPFVAASAPQRSASCAQ